MTDEAILMSASSVGTMRPVSDITLHIGQRQYTYAPENVTPKDMPYLLHLMVALVVQPHIGAIDCASFVNEHKLWHCFKERP